MDLCLVRHGIAGERGPLYPDDSKRPLTAAGRERMAEAAAGLRELFSPDVVFSSPLTRARETAEIVAAAYGCRDLRFTDALADGDGERLLSELAASGAARTMAVGHEPFMSATLSWLLTGDPERMASEFKKGAAALVECAGPVIPGRCSLAWLIQPAGLRAIGHAAKSAGH
jgi:phosphohistidine phosphatase